MPSKTSLAPAGIDRVGFTKGVSAADYDNDGFVDLYVSNFKGQNFLYRNNRNNTFTELARAAGVPGPGNGFATWFFDYDNDGWSDLFATSYFTSVDESVRTYLGLAHNAATLKLYKNLGDGTFRDVTTDVGLDKVFMPMGANFGDIDNDGFLDIHLGTGNPSYASLLPNVLLRNKEGKSFVDVTASSGTGELHKGHGIAFADLDNDGDEEIIAEIGGATPGDSHPLRLFENPGHGNDWISLRLVGVKTNRAAIGARIKLTVENEGRGTARSIAPSGAAGRSVLHPWNSTSAWASRRGSSSSRSGGPPATLASALRASRRISPSRSPSWRGATPASSGRPITLGGGRKANESPRRYAAASGGPAFRVAQDISGDRHGAESRSLTKHLHRLDSGDPWLHVSDDDAVRGEGEERARRPDTWRQRGIRARREPELIACRAYSYPAVSKHGAGSVGRQPSEAADAKSRARRRARRWPSGRLCPISV